MKKKTLKKLGFLFAFAILSTLIYNRLYIKTNGIYYEYEEGDKDETEEEMKYESQKAKMEYPFETNFNPATLKGDALIKYEATQERLKKTNNTFSSNSDFNSYFKKAAENMASSTTKTEYSYANNSLKGFWETKKIQLFDNTGFRADGSIYDPINELFYVVSSVGHLYKVNEDERIQWSLRNNKKILRDELYNGINLPDNSFRLVNQKHNSSMEFSDDEGRTWIKSNGAYFQNGWNFKTLVTKKSSGERRIIAHGGRYINPENIGHHRIYISDDYGLNYYGSLTISHLKISEFEVQICKPHNSKSVYCFARRRSDSRVFMYVLKDLDTDFKYIGQPVTLNGLESVVGTEINGTVHFYISFNKKNIFYSSDSGSTWQETSSDNKERNIAEIHPTKPNIIFRGFVDLNISTDFGATWTPYKHVIANAEKNERYYVHDVEQFRSYDKEDGTNVTFAGLHFGSFYSNTPEDFNSWTAINVGSPTMMSYDSETSERHNRIFSGNQDRGTQSFLEHENTDDKHIYETLREATTDILRVAISKSGQSVWHWNQRGRIRRGPVVNGGNFRKIVSTDQIYTAWAATNMIASPDPNEDAIYIPWDNNLHKWSFVDGKLERSFHPYKFSEPVHSFGYSSINRKRWYGGLKSGIFMYSEDGGNSFKESSYDGIWPVGEGSAFKRRTVIKTCPVNEATVYYAGLGNNFLISTDGGASFTNHITGLNVERISDLDVSSDGKYIFAACEFYGAWVFSVDQDRWFRMGGKDIPTVSFTGIQYIDASKAARFGTYGCGILDFKISEGITNELADGFYKIQLQGSGRCMNVDGWGGNGASILQWDCVEQNNSRFYVEKQNDNTYAIRASYNNKALTVDPNPINGSTLSIHDDLNKNNQRFILKHNGDSYYTISPANSPNKALAVGGNNIDKLGEPVIIWDFFNQNNYDWKFIPTTIDPVTLSNNDNLIKNKTNVTVNVFPNPVINNFNITFNEINNPTVIIINSLGKVVYTQKNITNSSISLSKDQGFATGVYIIKATDKTGKVYTKKFIIN